MLQTIKKISYKLDVLIIITILTISTSECLFLYFSPYLGGLRNKGSLFLLCFIVILFLEPLKIFIVLAAIIRIFSKSIFSNKHAKYLSALLSFLILIGSWSWLVTFMIDGNPIPKFLKGYEKWVTKNIDINSVQNWLESGEADKYIIERDSNNYFEDSRDNLPDFITSQDPSYIFFNGQDTERGKSIELEWGGGMEHWGIVIGLPSSNSQQEGINREQYSSYTEHRHPIQTGVYIFNGG